MTANSPTVGPLRCNSASIDYSRPTRHRIHQTPLQQRGFAVFGAWPPEPSPFHPASIPA